MTGQLSRGDIRHLHELAAMKDKGVLTLEEFNQHKSRVFERSADHRVERRSRRVSPWLGAAVAAMVLVGAAIVISAGGSSAHQSSSALVAQHN